MQKIIDITGQTFGKLTVLSFSHTQKKNGAFWICRCECGTEKIISGACLRQGTTKSCGCAGRARLDKFNTKARMEKLGASDLSGMRFGALVVIGPTRDKHGKLAWECECVCGKFAVRLFTELNTEANASCGCQRGIKRRLDLAAKRFGRLTAIEIDEELSKSKGKTIWKCRCDCGNTVFVGAPQLSTGHTNSCGCLRRESSSRHAANVLANHSCKNSKYNWHITVGGKCIHLRSSFEVIFAKYLLKHRIRFEYEPRKIQLAPDIIYIPDFYLPDSDTWVEVKGYAHDGWPRKRALFEKAGYKLLVVTMASLASYLPGISYGVWMKRNAHKYLRNSVK